MNLQDKINQVFKTHPKLDKVFITSDNNVFAEHMWANSHANGLYNKDIKIVERVEDVNLEEGLDQGDEEFDEESKEDNTGVQEEDQE